MGLSERPKPAELRPQNEKELASVPSCEPGARPLAVNLQKLALPFIECTEPWRRYSLALEQACELHYHGSLDRRGWGPLKELVSKLWPAGRGDSEAECSRERTTPGKVT